MNRPLAPTPRSLTPSVAALLLFVPIAAASAPAPEPDKKPLAATEASPSTTPKPNGGGAEDTGTRLLVLPYQPIYRSVEPDKAKVATDLVVKELGRSGDFSVVRGGVAKEGTKAPDAAPIVDRLNRATEARAKKNLGEAIAELRGAIAEAEKNPSALDAAKTYIDAHHQLARALFQSGNDEEARKVLEVAARMAPSIELPPEEYSRFYRRELRAMAARVVKDRPAEILVRSALPGATVYLDGREAEVTPVRLQRALPGKHLVQAKVEGVPTAAAVVDLKAGKNREVTVSFGDTWGGIAVGAVADDIAENRLSAKAVKKAVEAGREAGADFVVAGGIAKDKVATRFNVHTFVVNPKTGGVRQLGITNFDLDMLTAASDVINIIRGVEQSVKDFGDAKRAVASIEGKVRPQSIINEFNAKPEFTDNKRRAPRRARRERRRGPVIVTPLRGSSTLRIKDEED